MEGKDRSVGRQTCPRANLSYSNVTWIGLGSSPVNCDDTATGRRVTAPDMELQVLVSGTGTVNL